MPNAPKLNDSRSRSLQLKVVACSVVMQNLIVAEAVAVSLEICFRCGSFP